VPLLVHLVRVEHGVRVDPHQFVEFVWLTTSSARRRWRRSRVAPTLCRAQLVARVHRATRGYQGDTLFRAHLCSPSHRLSLILMRGTKKAGKLDIVGTSYYPAGQETGSYQRYGTKALRSQHLACVGIGGLANGPKWSSSSTGLPVERAYVPGDQSLWPTQVLPGPAVATDVLQANARVSEDSQAAFPSALTKSIILGPVPMPCAVRYGTKNGTIGRPKC
jgi:hypothetical protein